jgi:ergothioneine biosynthesis protein EgtB
MPNPTASSAPAGLSSLLARYRAVRAATLAFTAPLSPEDMMVQSCPDASPIKWHLAHTSWFFETFVLTPYAGGYKAFHPDFHWLFNSYYNSLGDMPAKNLRSSFSRPGLDQILAFRTHVDLAIAGLLDQDLGESEPEILRRIALGLEHEQQHLELAAYDIKHALFTNPLHPAYKQQTTNNEQQSTVPLTFTPFQGGLIEVGLTPDPGDPLAFCFDNETPQHKVFLRSFELANRLVTVREYLAFIDDNGYSRPELWLSEGWTTLRNQGWEAPLYWVRTSHSVPHLREAKVGWSIYTLSGFQPLSDLLETPVCHLSFFEADAFARWSGCRLPTEFEWEHAASTVWSPNISVPHSSGSHPDEWEVNPQTVTVPPTTANFLETGHLHPTPALPVHGLQQMFGDVWEWTASPYTGYPGYQPLPGALGEYNGKFMSSQIILRGGSAVTPATHIRPTYRNFFSPSTRWQLCGLRLAR